MHNGGLRTVAVVTEQTPCPLCLACRSSTPSAATSTHDSEQTGGSASLRLFRGRAAKQKQQCASGAAAQHAGCSSACSQFCQ